MKRLVVLIIVMSSLIGMTKTNAQVAVGVSVGIAPPEIPVYTQPPCPVDGYLWEIGPGEMTAITGCPVFGFFLLL